MKGFLAGLGIGALIGVVVAPRSGEETRRALADAANQRFGGIKDDLNQHLEEFKDSANESIGNIKQQVDQHVSSVRESMSAAKEKISGRNSLLEIINDWPQERLIEIDGIGPVLASKIIENRPYKADTDLVESKILPPSAIDALRKVA
jgi:gas vesicle protein